MIQILFIIVTDHYDQESVEDWGDSHSSQLQPVGQFFWHRFAKGLHIIDDHHDDDIWCYIPWAFRW